MEGDRELDPAGCSGNEHALSASQRWMIAIAFALGGALLWAQPSSPQSPYGAQLEQFAARKQWSGIVNLLQPVSPHTAEMDFYLGIALAHLGRLTDAQAALEDGRRLAPSDLRFATELAGIAFEEKNYPQAIHRLRESLRLAPDDEYANDFLGTAYFLEGNLEASLKYWNRASKPEIAELREDPPLRIAPALLDRAFAFSPAALLTLREFSDTRARVDGLGIFPQSHFDLNARSDGKFDIVFRAHELDGLGDSKFEALFLFFQGLPFQEVNPQFYNAHREAINFISMVRWDAQKRRIFADFSGPFERDAKYRWDLTADLRDENWAVRNGPAPVLAGFNLRDGRAGFAFSDHAGDRFAWALGAGVSHRNFRNVAPGNVLTPQVLASGYELSQRAQITGTIWRMPERRFTVAGGAESEAARLWSQPSQSFEKLTGSLGWHWFPQIKGDDFETSQQLRAGKTFGQPPFDELFILGLERDSDLPMRAHIGTRDGRKGSAPLGRNYLLENWELNKNLYGNGIVKLQLGPLFDIGKITDPGMQLGSRIWLFDTGAQIKLRVFGSGVAFSYGKDLRTGNNAFYVELLRQ
jgi:tetratricopeptide (TPR) repeat protein